MGFLAPVRRFVACFALLLIGVLGGAIVVAHTALARLRQCVAQPRTVIWLDTQGDGAPEASSTRSGSPTSGSRLQSQWFSGRLRRRSRAVSSDVPALEPHRPSRPVPGERGNGDGCGPDRPGGQLSDVRLQAGQGGRIARVSARADRSQSCPLPIQGMLAERACLPQRQGSVQFEIGAHHIEVGERGGDPLHRPRRKRMATTTQPPIHLTGVQLESLQALARY